MAAVDRGARAPRLLPPLGRARRRWRDRRALARARALAPALLAALPPPDGAVPATWRVRRAQWAESEVAILIVGPPGRPATAVLKLPVTAAGAAGLLRQRATLATLRADPRLRGWSALLPECLAAGEVAGRFYLVERALPGHPATDALAGRAASAPFLRAAADAIGELHRRTATTAAVDAAALDRWVDRPLGLLRGARAAAPRAPGQARALDRLAAELRGALAGRRLCVGWTHGDYWPGNLLLAPGGAALTGIVDWDRAEAADLPLLDLVYLVLTTRQLATGRELGAVALALLDEAGWLAGERALLDAARAALPGASPATPALVLLAWLRHVAGNVVQSAGYARDRRWMANVVEIVLRRFAAA
ncbi:MAG TPA: aminoglycoside phosphotransferase family protein [Thermomicrobiales bacterium]|nr:aminoglycoside phosphotransferase family protein [Thermomicrobiales bacterium]